MTVSMGMLIFAGLGYALEKDEEKTQFYTLPQVWIPHLPFLISVLYPVLGGRPCTGRSSR